jgi:peroxiredoxin
MKLLTALLVFSYSFLSQAIEIGQKAPDFSAESAGFEKIAPSFKLSNFKGQIVVLEWLNHGCPFVKKHYGSGNMQSLQKKYTSKGIKWFSVISSAPGKQGHVDALEAQKQMKEHQSFANRVLLDPSGKVGQLYGAKTTPHFFILDSEGKMAYQGAIDDQPDTNPESVKTANNFIAKALDEMLEKKAVTTPNTKAYGCSVKY